MLILVNNIFDCLISIDFYQAELQKNPFPKITTPHKSEMSQSLSTTSPLSKLSSPFKSTP